MDQQSRNMKLNKLLARIGAARCGNCSNGKRLFEGTAIELVVCNSFTKRRADYLVSSQDPACDVWERREV